MDSNLVTEIRTIPSIALHPREGVAYLALSYGGRSPAVGPAWPEDLAPGQIVMVRDDQGWSWRVEIEEITAPGRARAGVIGERAALPLPALTRREDGSAWIRLPNIFGHAHLRAWRTGDVVELEGAHWRVKAPKKPGASGSIVFDLLPVSEQQYATRPGRVRFTGQHAAEQAVGSALATPSGEWLMVKEVKVQTHRDQEDGAVYGRTWIGFGRHVSTERAAKINAVHGPTLARDLGRIHGARVTAPAAAEWAVLIPRDPSSYAATGERVAVEGSIVLHERVGDPDRCDGWHHYVVAIEDVDLLRRVRKFITSTR